MGKTFGPLKRPGKGAVPALLRKQPTTAVTQTATAADDEAAKSWKTDRSSNKMHGMIDGGHLPKRLVPWRIPRPVAQTTYNRHDAAGDGGRR